LIGTDDHSNISNYKYTNFVEIVPVCKDDLLYLPAKTARNLGNISRLVLVKNITSMIHLVDPLSGQTAQMSNDVYWRDPIRPIITAARSRFVRYIILGKDPVIMEQNQSKKAPTRRNRAKLACLTTARENDLGVNDIQFEERSHVGYLMKSGDVAIGYDLTDIQLVDDEAEAARNSGKLPSVVILRKLYGGAATGETAATSKRIFKLQRLEASKVESNRTKKAKKDDEDDDMDEEDFLQEVEADKEMRVNINLYKTDTAEKKEQEMKNGNNDDEDDEDDQKVNLDELLDGLMLDDGPDKDMEETEFEINEDLPWGGVGQEFVEEGQKAAKDGITYVGRDEAKQIKEKEAAIVANTFGQEFMNKPFQFK
jgi:nonsense-mediated mRNA decay protein 3